MNGWVGLNPLRVQALVSKIQSEKAQISELESRIAAIQNNISWEIAAKNDVDETLRRARNKIRRRAELLAELENSMRDAVDTFTATDKRRTKNQSTLEYWSALAAGGTTAVAALSSLAMTGGESLFGKIGSLFSTGTRESSVTINKALVSEPMMTTSDPLAEAQGKEISKKAVNITNSILNMVGKTNAFINDTKNEIRNKYDQEIEDARQRGLNGEKPTDGKLLFTNPKAYFAQVEAWKSSLSPEELAAYEAAKEEERREEEKNKSFFEKAADKLGHGAEMVGNWAEEQVEDFKVNFNGMVEEVNDFLDEHPAAKYTIEVGKDALDFAGNVTGFAIDIMAGHPIKAYSSDMYSTVDSFFNMAQDSEALLNYGLGKVLEGLGTRDDAVQSYYDAAEASFSADGLAGMFEQQVEQGGTEWYVAQVMTESADTINDIYSGVSGLVGFGDAVFNPESGKNIMDVLVNWKNPEKGKEVMEMVGYYDDLISNTGVVSGVIESALEKDALGIISTVISPIKSGKKIASVFGIGE